MENENRIDFRIIKFELAYSLIFIVRLASTYLVSEINVDAVFRETCDYLNTFSAEVTLSELKCEETDRIRCALLFAVTYFYSHNCKKNSETVKSWNLT